MKTIHFALIAGVLMASPAGFTVSVQAASTGVACEQSIHLLVSEKKIAEAQMGPLVAGCEEMFSVNGGYFAIAATTDGLGASLAAGFRNQDGATERALTKCEALGAGDCRIVLTGRDGMSDG
jgi:hypothetical protein